nr:hypothetical protein [Angustibacter aerolatus]
MRLFRAKVVDVSPDAVTVEATGNTDKAGRAAARARALRGPRASCSRAWSPWAAARGA